MKKVITNGHNKHLPPTNKNNIAISKPQPPPHIPKSSTNFSNVSNPGQSRLSGTSHLPNGGTNHSPNRVTASQHSPHRSTGSNHSPVRGSGTTTVSSMSTKPSSHVPPSSGGGSKPNSAIMNMPYRSVHPLHSSKVDASCILISLITLFISISGYWFLMFCEFK